MLMPPESVPVLLVMRLLAICRLWFQPWAKIPPPPWELSVMPKASMLEGLHAKSLANGLASAVTMPLVTVWQLGLASPTRKLPVASLPMSSVVPVGNPASKVGSYGFEGKFTPFPTTVIPAPSSAPIRLGSCNSSARSPLRLASQPRAASRGNRSTCGLLAVGAKPYQPAPGQLTVVVGSNGLAAVLGWPLSDRPNKQSTVWRHTSSLPAGCVFASMMLEAAPTPCSRTGLHIMHDSVW